MDVMNGSAAANHRTATGLLWFNPGGNWGDLYRHVQASRLEVWKFARENDIRFISGPQSIWYNPEKPKGGTASKSHIVTSGCMIWFAALLLSF